MLHNINLSLIITPVSKTEHDYKVRFNSSGYAFFACRGWFEFVVITILKKIKFYV